MVVAAWKQSTHRVQGQAEGNLGLRIVGTLRDGQIVHLSASKCTIGSAEGCTLRLRCVGVQPVNCLILRGSRGTVIRSWSTKTRLNGQPFSDAPLVAGDRLKIGPIELEVLATSSKSADSTQAQAACQVAEEELHERRADLEACFAAAQRQLEDECLALECRRSQYEQERQQTDIELDGLRRELEAQATQLREREAILVEHEDQRHCAELKRYRGELRTSE
jgi:hypothetical protein